MASVTRNFRCVISKGASKPACSSVLIFFFFFFILFSARLFAIAEEERGASKHSASREPFSAASRFYIPVFLRWGRGPRREIWASLGEEGDGLLRLFGDVLQSCFKNWPSGSGMQANPCLPRARASDRVCVRVCLWMCAFVHAYHEFAFLVVCSPCAPRSGEDDGALFGVCIPRASLLFCHVVCFAFGNVRLRLPPHRASLDSALVTFVFGAAIALFVKPRVWSGYESLCVRLCANSSAAYADDFNDVRTAP